MQVQSLRLTVSLYLSLSGLVFLQPVPVMYSAEYQLALMLKTLTILGIAAYTISAPQPGGYGLHSKSCGGHGALVRYGSLKFSAVTALWSIHGTIRQDVVRGKVSERDDTNTGYSEY